MVEKQKPSIDVQTQDKERRGRESFAFLQGVPPEETFRVAQDNLQPIFGGSEECPIKDKKGRNLYEHYGEDECLRVLARTEYIAIELKKVLLDTGVLDAGGVHPVSDDTVDKVRKLILRLSPLGGGVPDSVWQKYPQSAHQKEVEVSEKYGYSDGADVYSYPVWDEIDRNENPDEFTGTPQELNFYHRLITHVLMTPIFVEEMVAPINQRIAVANANGEELPEKVFGYLRREDGSYRTIDVNRMKVRMLLHDIGRWATHHQDLHETMPDLIAHFMGIEPPLIQFEFDHEYRYFSEDDSLVHPSNIPIEETIFHFIDFIAKRSDENNLDDEKIRSLDQLVAHAIARAAGYNGKLEKYWNFIKKQTKETGAQVPAKEMSDKAIAILNETDEVSDDQKDSRQAQFCRREIMFLDEIKPFFGEKPGTGLLAETGTSLSEIVARGGERFKEELNNFDLYAYNKEGEEPPRPKRSVRQYVKDTLSGSYFVGKVAGGIVVDAGKNTVQSLREKVRNQRKNLSALRSWIGSRRK